MRLRHEGAGEVAFLLEPDLKEGRGGLRDVHAIRWAEQAQAVMLQGDDESLARNHDVLFAARVELHRRTGRLGDRLLLEEQDAIADALGYASADDMMAAVSACGPVHRLDERRGLGAGRLVAQGPARVADVA